MKKIKIAIADSGIDEKIYNNNNNIVSVESFVENNFWDKNGHGTLCYNFLQSYFSSNTTEYFILKIFNDNGYTNFDILVKALEKLTCMNIDVVNLSLSLTRNLDKSKTKILTDLLKILYEQGKIVICSAKNDCQSSRFPSCSEYVIGVKGTFFDDIGIYWINRNNDIQIITDMTPIALPTCNGNSAYFSGNSKAAAVFTGLTLNFLAKNDGAFNMDNLLDGLSKSAVRNSWTDYELDKIKSLYKYTLKIEC